MRQFVRSSLACFVVSLATTITACDQSPGPPDAFGSRVPASLRIDGEVWQRTPTDAPGDRRLERLFRERPELAGDPDLVADVVAFEAPQEDRIRFYWVRPSSAGDAWTWIETDGHGAFRSRGDGVAEVFPGDD